MLRDNPQEVRLQDYTPPEYFIDRADLRFELYEDQVLVCSSLAIRRNPLSSGELSTLRLHGESLELLSLDLDGKSLAEGDYLVDESGLTLSQVPPRFVFNSRVRVRPQDNTALEGLYKSGGMFCTQCEAEGFRKITWFLDRPDVMTRFRTSIVADQSRYPVLLSNGNLVEALILDDGKHQVTWEDPFPKPSYLFALVAGDLRSVVDRYQTSSGRDVDLRIYVEPQNVDKCDHAMRSLKQAMAWDEEHYGREYDLDVYMIVAVSDFNMGAMENKGLNIFNAKYVLARPETATDRDFQGIEGVIAHEYFHNWTGNRITCRDWFQLSLKEGLTVFRDQEFSADMGSREVKRIDDVRMLRSHQFAEDASPMAHPVRPDSYIEINNFYTATVYDKGAEVIRMQHRLLGPQAFRRGMDLYFARYDGQAVTTDDFLRCMADASDVDLEQFKLWYTQAGTPVLHTHGSYNADQGSYTLVVEQSIPPTPGQPDKEPLHIPLAMSLLDETGAEMEVRLEGEDVAMAGTRVLELRQSVQTFRFAGLSGKPVPSLLRGFSAPVRLNHGYSDQELMFLIARDADGFTRWDAAQILFTRILLARAGDPGVGLPDGLFDALSGVLSGAGRDRALTAEVLSMPSESYLGDQMEEVDVNGIHQARQRLQADVARALQQEFLTQYQAGIEDAPYDISPASIARRRLANLCLDYLMRRGDLQAEELCVAQYRRDHNMTDVISALSLIADSDVPARAELLDDFYQRWAGDPLVLDKWFMVQALSSRADTLESVAALTGHPDYSVTNPNRIRSLVGAFCTGNPAQFHRGDGAGYRFLREQVQALDAINPQIASRLLRAMTNWRRYDPSRQSLMKGELESILASGVISKDVYEIASKSLG